LKKHPYYQTKNIITIQSEHISIFFSSKLHMQVLTPQHANNVEKNHPEKKETKNNNLL